jgi:hypothetical protein
MRRIFVYRVYFTCDPETYYVVGACNVRRAIRRAKQSWRAFAVIRKNGRLNVCQVERLYKGAVVRVLKIASRSAGSAALIPQGPTVPSAPEILWHEQPPPRRGAGLSY